MFFGKSAVSISLLSYCYWSFNNLVSSFSIFLIDSIKEFFDFIKQTFLSNNYYWFFIKIFSHVNLPYSSRFGPCFFASTNLSASLIVFACSSNYCFWFLIISSPFIISFKCFKYSPTLRKIDASTGPFIIAFFNSAISSSEISFPLGSIPNCSV